MLVFTVKNMSIKGEITRIIPSVKNKYPEYSVTLPGRNSIKWVYAIIFLSGIETPNTKMVA
jgi:hypothetical protein